MSPSNIFKKKQPHNFIFLEEIWISMIQKRLFSGSETLVRQETAEGPSTDLSTDRIWKNRLTPSPGRPVWVFFFLRHANSAAPQSWAILMVLPQAKAEISGVGQGSWESKGRDSLIKAPQ